MAEKIRCGWPGNDSLMVAYHDEEWGVPVHDDRQLFEKLILDSFQAGLSWSTILKKRKNFKKAFDNFNVNKISNYDLKKKNELMNDAGIIRNRLKIEATVINAQKFLEKGDKVKFTVKFRGREMQHTHLGDKLMDRIINDTAELGKVEVKPKMEGRQIIMIVQPL